ncbi:tRNA epoxyqueuosine(34) reductase QueG [Aeromonas dhakensis]|uniref:tRNA epoxyqueuosine(34) reductase QueG n=1 Tax=Aeromonas TaxID=642 RepID=UPI0019200BB7|nr:MULTISPECIES: tRNA epoxyqueuosine(34) reductase QueG [Aeromonas]MDD9309107.1 tRNA epoxyqueuosine(34) reductase QueG [Aeromonas hydrophila]MBL0463278.1 tRNA epoxyqueuosine(34) reductase QueG [Aeromonas dhakensis]MBL0658711.1 tRNA epoxyqueuosine(34) reductase QueG [Aeromonas dhakensis]WPS58986.1 tRNA epoxyqueuosine(34) reductase QueG [Aeromonas dhakensis]WRT72252.1 tRNA epoxyqueuosine(34) reductase QueG [Aeromonas dhakensis]
MTTAELHQLAQDIKLWASELGFDQAGITDTDLTLEEPRLQAWLDAGYHGSMDYMARHGMMRARPHELLPGTLRVLSVRMNYLPFEAGFAATLRDPTLGYISRYALGRDYHKLLRSRLKQLGERIERRCEALGWRPFVDSAPILERPLAAKAGLGWVGKHSLLLNESAGSFFFLGELLLSLPLPLDAPVEKEQCGKCVACINICPTGAIVAPYVVDGRRCISYLTIENDGPIPAEFRPLMGNRIYGCDDCQLICPWNRYANASPEPDFSPRPNLHRPPLLTLWGWSESEFLKHTEGSPIRRIGYQRWRRNLAVALGNGPASQEVIVALQQALTEAEPMVAEHIEWALTTLARRQQDDNKKTRLLIRCIEKGLPDHA